MSSIVPARRNEPRAADIIIGAPVRAQTWREVAQTIHWLRGHGMQLIPAHAPMLDIASTSAAESLFYKVKPQGLAIARVWAIQVRQEEPSGGSIVSELEITLPGGAVHTVFPPERSGTGSFEGINLLQETVAKSSAETTLELQFERTAGDKSSVFVESVECFELPRVQLTQDTTDKGIDIETLRPNAAMYDGANSSLGAVAEILTDSVTQPKRVLWAQSFPLLESDPGGAANPTSWVDLFTLPLPMHPRRVRVGDTTYDADYDVRGFVSTGTFEVRITAASGATDTTSVTATTEGWLTPGATIQLDSEDVSTADGVPSGGLETVQIAVRRTAGAGKISVRSVSVLEAS